MRIDDDGLPVRHTVKDSARRLTPRQRSQLDGSVSKETSIADKVPVTKPVMRIRSRALESLIILFSSTLYSLACSPPTNTR